MPRTVHTVESLRAAVEAGKAEARRNIRRDWGTDDTGAIIRAVLASIPGSASPADAARKARNLVAA